MCELQSAYGDLQNPKRLGTAVQKTRTKSFEQLEKVAVPRPAETVPLTKRLFEQERSRSRIRQGLSEVPLDISTKVEVLG